MNKEIIYGGAFNPPTKGHFKIIKYLINKFPNHKLIILPTNNYYKSEEIVSYEHRKEMLEIMCKEYIDNLEISDYEQTLDKYYGTYYTLKYFNHPLFVIGADSLETIHKWINYPNVVIDNHFIVFPRKTSKPIMEIINENEVLKENKKNFIICDDFEENDISSTDFRENKNFEILTCEVLNYIKNNFLYL